MIALPCLALSSPQVSKRDFSYLHPNFIVAESTCRGFRPNNLHYISAQQILTPTSQPALAAAIAHQPHSLPLLVTTETCSDATYIVTGANTGLGLEAAKHLVALGAAKVILAVCNVSAGETARTEIEAATGTSNVAEVWALDLASYDSVKAFAQRASTELARIDALIENAGVAAYQRVTAEGHLVDVTVNVLSTLLLGLLLLPKMSESAQRFGILPHLVVVTSAFSFDSEAEWNKIKDDPLVKMDDEEMPVMETYVASK